MSEAKMEQFNEEAISSFRQEVITNLSHFKIIDSEIDTDTSCDYKKYYDKHLGDKLKSTFLAFIDTDDLRQEQNHANVFRVFLELISHNKMSYRFLDQLFVEFKDDERLTKLLIKLLLRSNSDDNIISSAVNHANMEPLKGLHNIFKQIILNDAEQRSNIHAYLFEAIKMIGFGEANQNDIIQCYANLIDIIIDLAVVMDNNNKDKSLLNKKFSNAIDDSYPNGTPVSKIFNEALKFNLSIGHNRQAILLFNLLGLKLTQEEFATIEDYLVPSNDETRNQYTVSEYEYSANMIEFLKSISAFVAETMPSQPTQQANPVPETKTKDTVESTSPYQEEIELKNPLVNAVMNGNIDELKSLRKKSDELALVNPDNGYNQLHALIFESLVEMLSTLQLKNMNDAQFDAFNYTLIMLEKTCTIIDSKSADKSLCNKQAHFHFNGQHNTGFTPLTTVYANILRLTNQERLVSNLPFLMACFYYRLPELTFNEFSSTLIRDCRLNALTVNVFTENRIQLIEKFADPKPVPEKVVPPQPPVEPEQKSVEPTQTSVEPTQVPAEEIQFDSAFNNSLLELREKIYEFADLYQTTKIQKYENARKAASDLYNTLNDAGKIYFSLKPTKINHGIFKLQCEGAISTARNTLDGFRDCKKIIANILGLLVLPLYLIAMAVDYKKHGRVTFFSTDSSVKISAVEDAINGFQPR